MMSSETRPHISPDLYEQLVLYFKYASSAYTVLCPRPNGKHLVSHFFNSDIQGFVARDPDRKEIVVAIRGSATPADILLDANVLLIPPLSPGISAPLNALVHSGFLVAWNSVVLVVLLLVRKQLKLHPDHTIATTGHSLGGSLALLAAITLKQTFKVRTACYSYGAPRTGNRAFAKFVNNLLGVDSYRVVHTSDGVPTMIPKVLGYYHHGVEYWQKEDPPTHKNTLQCSANGEDPHCSASIPSHGVNSAHLKYFGILATTPFCW